MKTSAKFLLSLLAILLSICCRAVWADTIGLNASAGYQANTPADNEDVTNSINFPLTLSPITLNSFSGSSSGASASVSGSVNFGSITGEAMASATSGGSAATAQFQGAWQDSLLVTSNTLAPGTPVSLLFTIILNGSLSCTGPLAGGAVGAEFSTSNGYDVKTPAIKCNTSLPASETLLVQTLVGQDIGLEGQLFEEADARDLTSPSTATADPPTTQFFIDSQTTGASYTTGSGNTYFTPATSPVPEVPSIVLLATGLFGSAAAFRLRSLTQSGHGRQ